MKEKQESIQSQKTWVRTDELQNQRPISDTVFLMVGADALPNGKFIVYGDKIDITHYQNNYESIVTAYYESIKQFVESYQRAQLNGIFAEMCFESMQWVKAQFVIDDGIEENKVEATIDQLMETMDKLY